MPLQGTKYQADSLMITQTNSPMYKQRGVSFDSNNYLTWMTKYLLVLQNICGFVMVNTYSLLASRAKV